LTPRQVLPYLAALLLLSWILGTLSRSGTGGASILSNSYWLVYLVYLIPLFAFVSTLILFIFLVFNWRILSDILGFGLAQRRKMKKKQSSAIRLAVMIGSWGIALGVLMWRCGGIFCTPTNSTQTLPDVVVHAVAPSAGPMFPSLAGLAGPAVALAGFLDSPWFSVGFLLLVIVSSIIIVRGFKVSMDEVRAGRFLPERVLEEGRMAVREALNLLAMGDVADPKTRIMRCYERMIKAAAGLGADVSVDRTARELENGIRDMFRLKGSGIRELTRLFEEARYSLHPISDRDSDEAEHCLVEIGRELEAISSTVEN
jgi:hypothetical protein